MAEVLGLEFSDFAAEATVSRGVPVRYVETLEGRVPVATVYDLLMAQFGVPRRLPGDYPDSYEDEDAPYTPAWQENFTGIGRKTVKKLLPFVKVSGKSDLRLEK